MQTARDRRCKCYVPWAGVVLLGVASLVWADKATEMSADFLEYLGSLEDDEDNWTDFASEVPDASQRSASSAASSSSSGTAPVRKADK